MPTPSQNQNSRLLEGRIETQEQRLENLSGRMDKYDEIISDLKDIVISLKSRADTNQKWIATMLTIGGTVVGTSVGSIVTYLLTHWRP